MKHLHKYSKFILESSSIPGFEDVKIINAIKDYLMVRVDIEYPEVSPILLGWDSYTKILGNVYGLDNNGFGFILKHERINIEDLPEMSEVLTQEIGAKLKAFPIYENVSDDQHIVVTTQDIYDSTTTLTNIFNVLLDKVDDVLLNLDVHELYEVHTDHFSGFTFNNVFQIESEMKYNVDVKSDDFDHSYGKTEILWKFDRIIQHIEDIIEMEIIITNYPPIDDGVTLEKTTRLQLHINIGDTEDEILNSIEELLTEENDKNNLYVRWD
jgi:hypothetical protein